ncbi:MAG: hypothetical protein JST40_02585 [Armatimonadetes bacterium]|nr:hypothetical protein [Armatimonadota bacterium]
MSRNWYSGSVIWAQGAVCFVIWLGYGLWLRRGADQMRTRLRGLARGKRVALGSVGLIGAMVVLLAGLVGIAQLNGLQQGTLVPWAWIAVALLGVIFVHMQVLAAGAMITLIQDEQSLGSVGSSKKEEVSE